MKLDAVWLRSHAVVMLVLGLFAQQVAAQVLNNGRLRFGNGTEDSVNAQGNLQQPFYFDSTLNNWYKLTFSSYPLDNAIGVGGDGSSEWTSTVRSRTSTRTASFPARRWTPAASPRSAATWGTAH